MALKKHTSLTVIEVDPKGIMVSFDDDFLGGKCSAEWHQISKALFSSGRAGASIQLINSENRSDVIKGSCYIDFPGIGLKTIASELHSILKNYKSAKHIKIEYLGFFKTHQL